MGIGYFCIFINIIVFTYVLGCILGERLGSFICNFHNLSTFLSILHKCLMNYEYFIWLMGTVNIPRSVCVCQALFSYSFKCFPPILVFSHIHALICALLFIHRNPWRSLGVSLYAALSSLVCCPMNSGHHDLPRPSATPPHLCMKQTVQEVAPSVL